MSEQFNAEERLAAMRADLDQASAALVELSHPVAAYYYALAKEGIPERLAGELALAYQSQMFALSFLQQQQRDDG